MQLILKFSCVSDLQQPETKRWNMIHVSLFEALFTGAPFRQSSDT
jgi:hypothetical protein